MYAKCWDLFEVLFKANFKLYAKLLSELSNRSFSSDGEKSEIWNIYRALADAVMSVNDVMRGILSFFAVYLSQGFKANKKFNLWVLVKARSLPSISPVIA